MRAGPLAVTYAMNARSRDIVAELMAFGTDYDLDSGFHQNDGVGIAAYSCLVQS